MTDGRESLILDFIFILKLRDIEMKSFGSYQISIFYGHSCTIGCADSGWGCKIQGIDASLPLCAPRPGQWLQEAWERTDAHENPIHPPKFTDFASELSLKILKSPKKLSQIQNTGGWSCDCVEPLARCWARVLKWSFSRCSMDNPKRHSFKAKMFLGNHWFLGLE